MALKGRDSTHPDPGTAKRPSRKCAKPRRMAAWYLEELGKLAVLGQPRSQKLRKLVFGFINYICSGSNFDIIGFTPIAGICQAISCAQKLFSLCLKDFPVVCV